MVIDELSGLDDLPSISIERSSLGVSCSQANVWPPENENLVPLGGFAALSWFCRKIGDRLPIAVAHTAVLHYGIYADPAPSPGYPQGSGSWGLPGESR
jgi:hypothetical protein